MMIVESVFPEFREDVYSKLTKKITYVVKFCLVFLHLLLFSEGPVLFGLPDFEIFAFFLNIFSRLNVVSFELTNNSKFFGKNCFSKDFYLFHFDFKEDFECIGVKEEHDLKDAFEFRIVFESFQVLSEF